MRHSADQLRDAYESTTGDLKVKGGELVGPCPACGGDDRFHIKRNGVMGCRGCEPGKSNPAAYAAIMTALGLGGKPDDTGQYPRSVEDPPPQVYGCTLEQYADRVGLPADWLKTGHPKLSDSKRYVKEAEGEVEAVFVPYLPEGGKFRVAIAGKDKYRYKPGSKAALYGLEWLATAKVEQTRRIVMVEGESDCHTLWWHSIAAVGVPGAGSVKVIEPGMFDAVREVYVVQESDKTGRGFPGKVAARFQEIGAKLTVIPLPLPAKDVNELHKLDPEKFHDRFQKAAKKARRASGLLDWRPTAESVNAKLKPIPWLCFPLLRPGLSLLWAPSFAGKSTLVLQICDAVARGNKAMGMLQCKKSAVRFVGYEQGTRDDKRRLWHHIGIQPGTHDEVDFLEISDLPRADQGGIAALDRALSDDPQVKLLVIDTLARFWAMGKKKTSANAYYQETEALQEIERLTLAHDVCTLMVHHSTASKVKASGTEAIRGVPRSLIHLDRPDQDKMEGFVTVAHNGAPGAKFAVTLRGGHGWQVNDAEFAEMYRINSPDSNEPSPRSGW